MRIASIFISNPEVLTQYEARQRLLRTLEKEVEDMENRQVAQQQHMDEVRSEWLTSLQSLVADLSRRFSEYMANINCQGRISLAMDERDYDLWGIQIEVSFRQNTPIQKLDAHLQSGGERSVSTMLYLIALQSSTNSPFRLVDEINQGMDPHNERMIFEEIVKSACKPELPQYFLITPKLLAGLDYGKDTTVQCIYNGSWQPEGWSPHPTEFTLSES